ncbi:MAG: hypothetical protein QG623_308 [Patescibacteria group bacterium]|nr:hypothetical protein [Patescibacteria group bacterium]
MEKDRNDEVGPREMDPETIRGIELCIRSQETLDCLLKYPPRLGETDTTSFMSLINLANTSMGAVVVRLREAPDTPLPDAKELARRATRHMMARLHPDKEDGDAELYKIASSVYETLKRDRVYDKREGE